MTTKTCCACGEDRDVSLFNRNRSAKDGLQSRCRDCQKEYHRNWVDDNRDHVNAYSLRKYHNMTPYQRAKFDEARKRWVESNPEKRRAAVSRWRMSNLDKVAAKEQRRRDRMQDGGVFIILRREMEQILADSCRACGSSEDIVVDHIIPLARGGRHSIGNLQPLCRSCNSRKHARFMSEFRHRTLNRRAA